STLLTKGRHEGPELAPPLRGQVRDWLQAEADAMVLEKPVATDPQPVTAGDGAIDLSKVGVPGSKLTFKAELAAMVLNLTGMTIAAPAKSDLHAVAPVFAVVHGDGKITVDMSFSNVDMTVAAGKSALLTPGILIITGWDAQAKLSVGFTKLETMTASAPD